MGTSLSYSLTLNAKEDHPHAYGDKMFATVNLSLLSGSSPRVWGQEEEHRGAKAWDRIIPTRMGTSFSLCYLIKRFLDHPHAYGDKTSGYFQSVTGVGSSPRVWGQAFSNNAFFIFIRIIPTRMGTSSRRFYTRSNRQDHPHAYGDKFLFFFFK